METRFKYLRILSRIGYYIAKFYFKLLEDSSSTLFYIYNLFSFTVILFSSTLIIFDVLNLIPKQLLNFAGNFIDFASLIIIFEWIGRFILASDFSEDFEKAFFKYGDFKRALFD